VEKLTKIYEGDTKENGTYLLTLKILKEGRFTVDIKSTKVLKLNILHFIFQFEALCFT